MMKKLSVFILLCAGISLSAQNIISTRPANAQDGKILTMEETVLSRSLNPAGVRHKWESASNQEFPKEILKGQSLYVAKAEGDTVAVAISENKQITYGQTVSRNEFGIDGGIFWSPDKTKLAFYRKDESKVTTFPLLDITTRTGSLVEIKYPMAGMDSENVKLGIYDVASGSVIYVNVDEFGYDQYLTNISWSPDASKVFIQVLDRSQKHIKLNMYDANDGSFIKTLLTEDNDRFVEPQDPIWFIKGSQNLFLYRTDNRDGYRNLYLCDLDGTVRRLTTVDADVHYVANDGKYVWYTSAEVSPIENHLFRVSIKVPKNAAVKGAEVVKFGKPERLTTEPGWHTISMSPDLTQYTDIWSSLCVPRMGNLCSSDGKVIENILIAEDPTLEYAYTEISLGTVKSADGKYDNYFRMIKPHIFDPTKKYPTIVYVYGGPHSQMVQNTFMGNLRRWGMYMAQRG
jgi:dipeptidyl-peptidase-4